MKTAQPVRELGLYTAACCGRDLIFYRSDYFRRCPDCGQLCDWQFVEKVIRGMKSDTLQDGPTESRPRNGVQL